MCSKWTGAHQSVHHSNTSFKLLYTIIKTIYLLYFDNLMYRSSKSLSYKDKLVYLYGAIFIGLGILYIGIVTANDVVHQKTVFETHKDYCADLFRNLVHHHSLTSNVCSVCDTRNNIFIMAITSYYSSTKQFCTCGTGPSDVCVSITLISATGLNASLLVVLVAITGFVLVVDETCHFWLYISCNHWFIHYCGK